MLGVHLDLDEFWADGAYTGGFGGWLRRQLGWRLEVPHHRDRQLWRYGLEEKPRGLQILPRRWVVERTFAWLGLSRRLSKDYERLPETGEAMIYGALSRLMLRRLAHLLLTRPLSAAMLILTIFLLAWPAVGPRIKPRFRALANRLIGRG